MAETVKSLAAALGAEAFGDIDLVVGRPAEPGRAGPDDLALAMSPAYAEALRSSAAQVALVWPGADWQALGLRAAIAVPRARLAMARLTQAFDKPFADQGIHPTAFLDPSAYVADDVAIGAFTSVGAGAVIGAGSQIADHVSVGAGAVLGPGARVFPGARIMSGARIGARAILHPNVVIGADGFSFVTEEPSNEERAFATAGRKTLTPPADGTRHRIHSLGGVVIGDDVEIGANSTVDAGTIRATQVGDGTKIDNLVQVGHNVIVGRDCVLCAQAAVAGSARLGDRVVLGGKSGVKDNITLGSDVVLAGGAIVLEDVPDGYFMMGYPALPMPEHRARQRALRRIAHKAVSKSGQSD